MAAVFFAGITRYIHHHVECPVQPWLPEIDPHGTHALCVTKAAFITPLTWNPDSIHT
jgi:hypothetical protein